jgi:hypothetical protein
MKKVAIIQPAYLPWLGFFEQMCVCDVFVYLDDIQYTKNDWRNRNRIKTKSGFQWLTIPVSYKFGQKINEVKINNSYQWYKKHFNALKTWYGKSPFFHIYSEELKEILYRERIYLVELDLVLIQWLAEKIGFNPQTVLSSGLSVDSEDRQYRLIDICKTLESDFFYEGESGQNYIDTGLFRSHGITVNFQKYRHPYYNQLWLGDQGFISHLSIVDLLFNHGADSLPILLGDKVIQRPAGISVRHADAG